MSAAEFDRINGFQRLYMTSEIAEDAPSEAGPPRERFWDALTAVSNVIFAVALLPTVLAGAILPISSSIATIVALCMLSALLIHFKLWWGLGFNVCCTSMWVILLIMAL